MALKDLTEKNQAKVKEHSKLHKGGMNSKHIKNMIKFMSPPSKMSFTAAHNKAVKEDKKDMKKKPAKQSTSKKMVVVKSTGGGY